MPQSGKTNGRTKPTLVSEKRSVLKVLRVIARMVFVRMLVTLAPVMLVVRLLSVIVSVASLGERASMRVRATVIAMLDQPVQQRTDPHRARESQAEGEIARNDRLQALGHEYPLGTTLPLNDWMQNSSSFFQSQWGGC